MAESKVKVKEMFGFVSVSLSTYFTMAAVNSFLPYFYTDVFGISAAAVSLIFLVIRFSDAFIDPVAGVIVDRTNTRWGKFRPYFLFGAIPYGVVFALLFFSPSLSSAMKIVYAIITFVLFSCMRSLLGINSTAVLTTMTEKQDERTRINVFSALINLSVGTALASLMLTFVAIAGHGNSKLGFVIVGGIYGVITVLLTLYGFVGIKEKVNRGKSGAVSLKESAKTLVTRPMIIIFLSSLFFYFCFAMLTGVNVYYIKYVLLRPGLVSVITLATFFSLIPGILVSPLLAKKLGMKRTVRLGFLFFAIGNAIKLVPGLPLFMVGTVVAGIGLALPTALINVMFAEVVDYGEWKTGIRAPGLQFAVSSFANRVGNGVGLAFGMALLAWGGYTADAVTQTTATLTAIKADCVWFPILFSLICVVIISFYNVDKHRKEIEAFIAAKAKSTEQIEASAID